MKFQNDAFWDTVILYDEIILKILRLGKLSKEILISKFTYNLFVQIESLAAFKFSK